MYVVAFKSKSGKLFIYEPDETIEDAKAYIEYRKKIDALNGNNGRDYKIYELKEVQ